MKTVILGLPLAPELARMATAFLLRNLTVTFVIYGQFTTSKIWTKDKFEVHSIFTESPILRKLCTLDVRNVLPAHINIVSKYAYCLENI